MTDFTYFRSSSVLLIVGFVLLLLPPHFCSAQSFAEQLTNNAHKHPQKHVSAGPVLPDGDSFGDSRALSPFRPGATTNSLDADKNAYGSIAPFAGSPSADAAPTSSQQQSTKSADADGSHKPMRFGVDDADQKTTNKTALKKLLVRRRRAAAQHGHGINDAYQKPDVHENEFGPKYAKCAFVDNVVHRQSDKARIIHGAVLLQQENANSVVNITGIVHGLPAGVHGFHLTEFGDISDYCFGVGRHYNPFNRTHGAPYDKERHVGDLGNIIADAKGVAQINIVDKVVSLFARYSVMGRALVIHAIADDLGRGEPVETSKLNGNPGPHIACCTIGIAMDDTLTEKPASGQAVRRPDSFGFA